jgi:hypothetical protein
MQRPSQSAVVRVAAVLVVLFVVWLVRPVFHGLAMFFWTRPLSWLPPLLVLLVGFAVLAARVGGGPAPGRRVAPAGRATDPRLDPVRRRRSLRPRLPTPRVDREALRGSRGVGVVLGLAFLAFLAGSIARGPLTAAALYADTRFEEIPGLPADGNVRIVPRDVAEVSAASGFNSPTERLSNFAIVNTRDGLEWTALRTPNGLVRTFTKKSQGLASLDASSSARQLELTDAEFQVAPGLRVTDSLRWRLLKRRFLIDLADPVAIRDERDQPRILVPYISYRGFLTRRPQLGGAFLVAPDGTIEDLSPEEARRRPEIARSGRLFPPTLARQLQDAYAYKNGIWNRLFIHEEQTQISDTEANPQPYLIDFGERGLKWVTVAEPYGRAFAVNAIFLTDAATGRTQIWRVPRNRSLSGNRRALQTVRSLTIPGVVFAGDGAARGAGGGFRVVEPRPVFVEGQLVYLVSIIPEQGTSISKTVVIDAARNQQVAIFDNDSDPRADEKIARYLQTGEVPADDAAQEGAEQPADTTEETEQPTPAGDGDGGRGPATPAEVRRQLDELIERQREVLRDAEELRRALEGGR